MGRRLVRLLVVVLLAAAYRPLNRRPHTRVLDVPADHAIPLVPAFAYPYVAFIPLYWWMVVRAGVRGENFRRLGNAAIVVYAVSDVTYLVFQTHMPRPETIPDGPGAGLVRAVYSWDEPYCDFPSEHASTAVLFALQLHAVRSPLRVPGTALSALVLPATLVLKQHTLAGTLGGALLARVAWALAGRQRSRPT